MYRPTFSSFPGIPTVIFMAAIMAGIWPWLLWQHSHHAVVYLVISIAWTVVVDLPAVACGIVALNRADRARLRGEQDNAEVDGTADGPVLG